MLREKIMEWIGKTFGKLRHRDFLEMTCKVSDIIKNKAKIRVEEVSFIFQRATDSSSDKDVRRWKEELDEITGNSLRVFHTGNEELWGIAGPEDIRKGAKEGELVKGTGILLNVQIHKERFIANEIQFPSRRH